MVLKVAALGSLRTTEVEYHQNLRMENRQCTNSCHYISSFPYLKIMQEICLLNVKGKYFDKVLYT